MNKKVKKTILWSSLFALPLASITPIVIANSNTNTSVSVNTSNSNLEKKLSLNQKINNEEQKRIFNNVDVNDVLNQVTNINSQLYRNMQSNSNDVNNVKNVYEEINKNIDKFTEITQNILDGHLTIDEINSNLNNYKNNNVTEYSDILNEINTSIEEIKYEESQINTANYFSNITRSSSEFEKINSVTIVDDNGDKVTITSDQLAFYSRAEFFLSRLIMYRDKTYGVAIASSVLTAASWAIAAFYWSAWWMFGGNVPFAVAATVQASVSTIVTNDSFNDYYKTRDQVNELSSIVYSSDFKDYKDMSDFLLTKCEKYLSDGAIDFTKMLGGLTTYPRLLKKFFESKIVNKISDFIIKFGKKISEFVSKTGTSIFKKFLSNINKRVSSFLSKTMTNKVTMKAVSWASPATTVISVLDIVLGICSFSSDIAIFNPRLLSSW